MNLSIDEKVRGKYPDLRIGIVIANISNQDYKNGLEDYCETIFRKFSEKYETPKDLESIKNIIVWREIYRSFGVNPKKKKPTAEALLARVIKNNFVPQINPAVDAYLCAETLHCLPIGGYDLAKISGNISLRLANADETFIGIGEDAQEKTVLNEIIYADNDRVLTRGWNYKDCSFSSITTDTQKIALFSEAPTLEITDSEINETIDLIKQNLITYCKADCTVKFLSKDQNEINIV